MCWRSQSGFSCRPRPSRSATSAASATTSTDRPAGESFVLGAAEVLGSVDQRDPFVEGADLDPGMTERAILHRLLQPSHKRLRQGSGGPHSMGEYRHTEDRDHERQRLQ